MTTDALRDQVAATIRAEAARRRVSQLTIAEQLGLNQSQVSRRMNGLVDWTATELRQVAQLLEVPASQLLGEAVA